MRASLAMRPRRTGRRRQPPAGSGSTRRRPPRHRARMLDIDKSSDIDKGSTGSQRRAATALLPRIDVRGVDHLASALDSGRGAVVISTHFGFPHLIRMVLTERG